MSKTLELTELQAELLKNVLHAVYKTWRRSPGMNIGSSQVHNLYSQDLDTIIKIHDMLQESLMEKAFDSKTKNK